MANVLCLAKALGGGGAQGSAWLATPRGRGWPRAPTQEVLVGRGHPHVLQDEGDVLPLPQAARDEGRGASHAVLRSLLGHAGVGGHLSHFEGLQLLMAWKMTRDGWSQSPAALPRVFPRCCSLQSSARKALLWDLLRAGDALLFFWEASEIQIGRAHV